MAKINAKGGMEPEPEVFTTGHDQLFINHTVDLLKFAREEPPAYDFVLPGFLVGTVGALISPGGTGKSMLAIEAGLKVCSGIDFTDGCFSENGLGGVCYLSGEDPEIALWHRFHTLLKALPHDLQEHASKHFRVLALAGLGITLDAHFAAIEQAATGRRLLILDTLKRLHDKDENSSTEMGKVMSTMECIAKSTGAAILFLHHSSKAAALGGMGDSQQASRGSSVLVDNARWQGYLAGMTTAEAEKMGVPAEKKGFYVRYGVSKCNYSAPVEDFWLERRQGGILTKATFESATQATKKPNGKKNEPINVPDSMAQQSKYEGYM